MFKFFKIDKDAILEMFSLLSKTGEEKFTDALAIGLSTKDPEDELFQVSSFLKLVYKNNKAIKDEYETFCKKHLPLIKK